MAQYVYDRQKMSEGLTAIIAGNSSDAAREWLQQRLEKAASIPQFNQTFTAIPRFTGKNRINVSPEQAAVLHQLVPGFFVHGWTLDRLIRAWWLLQLDAADKAAYLDTVEKLFLSAEMNELAALYSALPLLAYPEAWTFRTAEGVRSNIGVVQEAIMLQNPYPARYLDEPAWNQLVMKAIFTDKPLHLISGLDQRSNAALAAILTDFAHERWAAGRKVSPMQWRLLTGFVTVGNMADLTRVWHSADQVEKAAAALVFSGTDYAPAKTLLASDPALSAEIQSGALSWDVIAAKLTQN